MMGPTKKNRKSGFTLIELLVVISIISLLSSITLASLNSAREKARDAKRLADFDQIEIALALYYDDNGEYPVPLPSNQGWFDIDGCSAYADLYPAIAQYIASPVVDPLPNRCNWYQVRNGGKGYIIGFETEQHSLAQKSPINWPDAGEWFEDERCRGSGIGVGTNPQGTTWYCTGVNF